MSDPETGEAPNAQDAPTPPLDSNEAGEQIAADGTVIGPVDPTPGDRPEWLPEKFKTPEALAESYKALEKKLGQKQTSAVPETYDLKINQEPAELSTEDAALFKKWGLSNESAQELLEYATEQVFPQLHAMALEVEQTKLAAGWNMQGDSMQFKERIDKIGAWARDNLPAEAVAHLRTSASGVQALWVMMGNNLQAGAPQGQPGRGKSKAELQSMVSDARYRNDPGYREQVEQEFQRAYGS